MISGLKKFLILVFLLALGTGCSSGNLERINQEQSSTIQSLNKEITKLNEQLNTLAARENQTAAGCQETEEGAALQQLKAGFDEKLSGSVQSGDLSVQMQDRGIVVTVLDRILFDPGRADLKPSAIAALDQVAGALQGEASQNMVYIEGHTDNEPVPQSVWRSNWELSTARATEVVHYFSEQKGIDPARLAATGYGEFRPAVSNETPEGRMKNRRVEIVISPKTLGE